MANILCPNCGNTFKVLPDICPYCCAQLGAPKNPGAPREMLEAQRNMLINQRTELTKKIAALDVLLGDGALDPPVSSLGFDAFRQQGGEFGQ